LSDRRRMFAGLLVAGLVVRVLLTATSIGTNDAVFETLLVNLVRKYGIAGAYVREAVINRSAVRIALFPPLTLAYFKTLSALSAAVGLEYTDVLRHAQSVADVVTTLSLYGIATRYRPAGREENALFFFLGPAAIFISAFHCNTDSTMIALTTLAVFFLAGERPMVFLSGVTLAAATGIKILPLFLVPFFFVLLQRRIRFIAGYAAGFAAVFLPAAIIGRANPLAALLSYSGYAGKWGFVGVFLQIETALGRRGQTFLYAMADAYASYGKYLVILALAALAVWLWLRRRATDGEPLHVELLMRITTIVFLLVLFLAPGFGVQYLLWPIPFLMFTFDRWLAYVILAGISVYLFITYTIWSRGFPWWYADSIAAVPHKQWVTFLGFPLWMLFGYAAARGIRDLRRA
jgi:hypothetical protein